MIPDHEKTTAQLKSLVESGKVKAEIPTAMDDAHKSKIDELKGEEQGDEFDEDYDEMQVEAHEDAVSLFERYAQGGDNADLKAFAAETLPKLQHHLEMAKALK